MSLQIQVTADVAGAGKQIEDFSKRSRTALNSLSLVAQDLPFGFIGIQNNLPGVISSFGELTREAGGVGGALKQLSTALVGPAGLFLAFSVVTSAITFAIQKYGSLGAAFDALIGKTNLATKAQQDFNKTLIESTGSSATEVAEIQILVAVLTDLTKPLKERQAAYVELKNIRPDVIAGQKLENISTEKATKLIKDNASAVLNLILLKSKESAIATVLNKNAEDFAKLLIEENDLKKRIAKSEKDYADNRKNSNDFDELSARIIQGLTKKLNTNKKEQENLTKVAQEYIKILDPTIKGIAEVDRRTNELTESIKKQKKEREKKPKKVKELDLEELGRKARRAANKLQEQADKNRLRYLQEQLKLQEKITKETFAQADKQMKVDAEAFTKVSFLNLEKVTKPLAELQKKLEESKFLLNEVFFNPLQDAFMNLFETGKFAFKAFGDAVLKQIQQLVSKIIATGIISLIANLLFPGVGVAAGGASLLKKVGADILGAIGLGGAGAANPSFGGVGPGSMGMSGQVNVVLRGSDLVGALNRTNATINRVG
jgi:hypothetical protein